MIARHSLGDGHGAVCLHYYTARNLDTLGFNLNGDVSPVVKRKSATVRLLGYSEMEYVIVSFLCASLTSSLSFLPMEVINFVMIVNDRAMLVD